MSDVISIRPQRYRKVQAALINRGSFTAHKDYK
jgi:hypothetical protein